MEESFWVGSWEGLLFGKLGGGGMSKLWGIKGEKGGGIGGLCLGWIGGKVKEGCEWILCCIRWVWFKGMNGGNEIIKRDNIKDIFGLID